MLVLLAAAYLVWCAASGLATSLLMAVTACITTLRTTKALIVPLPHAPYGLMSNLVKPQCCLFGPVNSGRHQMVIESASAVHDAALTPHASEWKLPTEAEVTIWQLEQERDRLVAQNQVPLPQ